MRFYKLSKNERTKLRNKIKAEVKVSNEKAIEYAGSNDVYIRKIAAQAISEKKDELLIKSMVKNSSALIRQTCCYVLEQTGQVNLKNALSNLKTLAGDEEQRVRGACVKALNKLLLKDPFNCSKQLRSWLSSKNILVKCCAIKGAELVGKELDPGITIRLVRNCIKDDNELVKKELLNTIVGVSYKLGAIKVINELSRWQKMGKDSMVKKAVKRVMSFHKKNPRICRDSYESIRNYLKKQQLL